MDDELTKVVSALTRSLDCMTELLKAAGEKCERLAGDNLKLGTELHFAEKEVQLLKVELRGTQDQLDLVRAQRVGDAL